METEQQAQADNRTPQELAEQTMDIFREKNDPNSPDRVENMDDHDNQVKAFFALAERDDTQPYTKEALEMVKKLVTPDGQPVEPNQEMSPPLSADEKNDYLQWKNFANHNDWKAVVTHIMFTTISKQNMADYRASKMKK